MPSAVPAKTSARLTAQQVLALPGLLAVLGDEGAAPVDGDDQPALAQDFHRPADGLVAAAVVAGRSPQDRVLTVTLWVCEDWESFEATTSIDITSPARPWLGTVRLSDDAGLDWCCDWRAAFHGSPAALIDVIIPVLRRGGQH